MLMLASMNRRIPTDAKRPNHCGLTNMGDVGIVAHHDATGEVGGKQPRRNGIHG